MAESSARAFEETYYATQDEMDRIAQKWLCPRCGSGFYDLGGAFGPGMALARFACSNHGRFRGDDDKDTCHFQFQINYEEVGVQDALGKTGSGKMIDNENSGWVDGRNEDTE